MSNPYLASGTPNVPPQQIPNYLVPSILSAICCCPIFGIVAIVYAAQVNGMVAGGNIAGAMQASKNAKMWMYIAIGLGLVQIVISMILFALGAVGAAVQQQPM